MHHPLLLLCLYFLFSSSLNAFPFFSPLFFVVLLFCLLFFALLLHTYSYATTTTMTVSFCRLHFFQLIVWCVVVIIEMWNLPTARNCAECVYAIQMGIRKGRIHPRKHPTIQPRNFTCIINIHLYSFLPLSVCFPIFFSLIQARKRSVSSPLFLFEVAIIRGGLQALLTTKLR